MCSVCYRARCSTCCACSICARRTIHVCCVYGLNAGPPYLIAAEVVDEFRAHRPPPAARRSNVNRWQLQRLRYPGGRGTVSARSARILAKCVPMKALSLRPLSWRSWCLLWGLRPNTTPEDWKRTRAPDGRHVVHLDRAHRPPPEQVTCFNDYAILEDGDRVRSVGADLGEVPQAAAAGGRAQAHLCRCLCVPVKALSLRPLSWRSSRVLLGPWRCRAWCPRSWGLRPTPAPNGSTRTGGRHCSSSCSRGAIGLG
jgi:hypothetical protein